MPQCKAQTASGEQCSAQAVAPSRSLCRRHQNVLATGKPVLNFETGKKFPSKAAAEPAKDTSARQPRRPVLVASPSPAFETERVHRGPGEHALMCEGPQCTERALAGTNYCMRHQSLA